MMELSDKAWMVVERLTRGKIAWNSIKSLEEAERKEILRIMVERGFVVPVEGDIVPEGFSPRRYTCTEEGYGIRGLGFDNIDLPVIDGRRYLFVEERFARAYASKSLRFDVVKIHKRPTENRS